jgi:fluoride exporter
MVVRGTWTRRRAALIAAGGAAGAGLRWAVVTTVAAGTFPWPVLAINVVGSAVLGVVLAEEWSHPSARLWLHDGAGIGFCGGLTTFSTFAFEVVDLARHGHGWMAAGYAASSVVLGIAAVVAGAAVLRRTRALSLPFEERP